VSGIARFIKRLRNRIDRPAPLLDATDLAPGSGNVMENVLDDSELPGRALAFEEILTAKKREAAPADFPWYPYGTIHNFGPLTELLRRENRTLADLIGGGTVLDIGCADGDLAFFLEQLGNRVQVVDYGPTNFNTMRGVRLLKGALGSSLGIHEVDLDAQFSLPHERYNLVFFLGILYHLKNPYYALEALAKSASYCFISTRITRFAPDKRTELAGIPVAYLLDPLEANNDSTNYWIFSEAGLRRILQRAGWDVCQLLTLGNITASDPASAEGDERAFCLAKSRHCP